MADLTYNPDVFEVDDEAAARRIILDRSWDQDTDERWVRETPYLTDLIGDTLKPGPDQLIVDYGCGIGRIAKVLIERFGCRVLGVDLSMRMRDLAPAYVAQDRFSVVSVPMFRAMVDHGLKADHALAIWVLQHCWKPDFDTGLLAKVLQPGGGLFVVNMTGRAVPAVEKAWASDGVDIRAMLAGRLTLAREGGLDPAVVDPRTAQISYWARYDKA